MQLILETIIIHVIHQISKIKRVKRRSLLLDLINIDGIKSMRDSAVQTLLVCEKHR